MFFCHKAKPEPQALRLTSRPTHFPCHAGRGGPPQRTPQTPAAGLALAPTPCPNPAIVCPPIWHTPVSLQAPDPVPLPPQACPTLPGTGSLHPGGTGWLPLGAQPASAAPLTPLPKQLCASRGMWNKQMHQMVETCPGVLLAATGLRQDFPTLSPQSWDPSKCKFCVDLWALGSKAITATCRIPDCGGGALGWAAPPRWVVGLPAPASPQTLLGDPHPVPLSLAVTISTY